jgi:hypothetical protein
LAGGATKVRNASSLSDAIGEGPAEGWTTSSPANGVNGYQYYYDYGPIGATPKYNANIFVTNEGTALTVMTPDGIQVVSPREFTVFSNGLVGKIIAEDSMTLTPGNTGVAGISGTLRQTEAVMLGGKAVDLEFTNFGFWESRAIAQGKRDGVDFNGTVSSYTPFVSESRIAEKMPPPSVGTFEGKVLANAWDRTDPWNSKAVSLVGDAQLSLASDATGNIRFSFANFSTLSTDLSISTGGAITPSGAFTISDTNKNTTGINISGGGSQTLTGQFYGTTGFPFATEAVGKFDYSNANTGVRGSFGVIN